MSFAEIKHEAEKLSAAEVIYLAAYFRHLSRRRDSAYLVSLDAAWEAAQSGDRVSLEDMRRLDSEASKAGL
ncbi:MAG: hypothetical protein ACREIA_01865 [Opitutaceae bacterium]